MFARVTEGNFQWRAVRRSPNQRHPRGRPVRWTAGSRRRIEGHRVLFLFSYLHFIGNTFPQFKKCILWAHQDLRCPLAIQIPGEPLNEEIMPKFIFDEQPQRNLCSRVSCRRILATAPSYPVNPPWHGEQLYFFRRRRDGTAYLRMRHPTHCHTINLCPITRVASQDR